MAKNTVRTEVGTRIVELRKALHFKQQTIADLIGVTRDCFAKYETTIIPPVDKLIAIAKVLDVTVDYLLGNENKYQITTPEKFIFASTNPYLNNADQQLAQEDLLKIDQTEYDLILKFRDADSEVKTLILKMLNE